jgi:hypothetical protein
MISISLLANCRATENSHVKTNLVHILHRIQSTGTQPLESFKDFLSPDDYQKCVVNPGRTKSWYPLTVDIFISLLFRVWRDILSPLFPLNFFSEFGL